MGRPKKGTHIYRYPNEHLDLAVYGSPLSPETKILIRNQSIGLVYPNLVSVESVVNQLYELVDRALVDNLLVGELDDCIYVCLEMVRGQRLNTKSIHYFDLRGTDPALTLHPTIRPLVRGENLEAWRNLVLSMNVTESGVQLHTETELDLPWQNDLLDDVKQTPSDDQAVWWIAAAPFDEKITLLNRLRLNPRSNLVITNPARSFNLSHLIDSALIHQWDRQLIVLDMPESYSPKSLIEMVRAIKVGAFVYNRSGRTTLDLSQPKVEGGPLHSVSVVVFSAHTPDDTLAFPGWRFRRLVDGQMQKIEYQPIERSLDPQADLIFKSFITNGYLGNSSSGRSVFVSRNQAAIVAKGLARKISEHRSRRAISRQRLDWFTENMCWNTETTRLPYLRAPREDLAELTDEEFEAYKVECLSSLQRYREALRSGGRIEYLETLMGCVPDDSKQQPTLTRRSKTSDLTSTTPRRLRALSKV